MTPETFKRLSLVAPLPKSVLKHPNTWLPFMRTLSECIEKQTILSDIATLKLPIDVCYGSLDQVVVSANVELLASNQQVRLHHFLGTHDLTTRYGQLVLQILSD